ncbi:MAG TPA: hypothetical protein VFP34_14410 [Microlunatus sp.]|nr:hypothetical protein [Microlunatus sp.]
MAAGICGQRGGQVGLEFGPFGHLGTQLGVEDFHSASSEVFGAIHGNVGLVHQGVGIGGGILADGDADAGPDDQG